MQWWPILTPSPIYTFSPIFEQSPIPAYICEAADRHFLSKLCGETYAAEETAMAAISAFERSDVFQETCHRLVGIFDSHHCRRNGSGRDEVVVHNDYRGLRVVHVFLVFRVREEADTARFAALYARESADDGSFISLHLASEYFSYLLCVQFHRFVFVYSNYIYIFAA